MKKKQEDQFKTKCCGAGNLFNYKTMESNCEKCGRRTTNDLIHKEISTEEFINNQVEALLYLDRNKVPIDVALNMVKFNA